MPAHFLHLAHLFSSKKNALAGFAHHIFVTSGYRWPKLPRGAFVFAMDQFLHSFNNFASSLYSASLSLHPCGRKQPLLSTVFWVWLYCTSLIWAAMALTGSFGFSGPGLRPSAATSPIPPAMGVSGLSAAGYRFTFQIRHEWPNFQAHPVGMTLILWKRKITSGVEDAERWEHSRIADGNVKGRSCCEKQCSGSSKT